MKKIVAVLLAVIVLFAFLLELGGKDKKKEWSFRSYCEYVTENVVPLPEISLNIEWDDGDGIFNRIGKFFDFIWSLVSFPFTYAFVLIKNVGVLLSGFFPISMPSDPSYSMYYFTCENGMVIDERDGLAVGWDYDKDGTLEVNIWSDGAWWESNVLKGWDYDRDGEMDATINEDSDGDGHWDTSADGTEDPGDNG